MQDHIFLWLPALLFLAIMAFIASKADAKFVCLRSKFLVVSLSTGYVVSTIILYSSPEIMLATVPIGIVLALLMMLIIGIVAFPRLRKQAPAERA